MKWSRGGLVFEAHRLLYHSTLGVRVIKKQKKFRVYFVLLHLFHSRQVLLLDVAKHHPPQTHTLAREFFIDNLLVRIHFIIVMIRWTGLAPWEFDMGVPRPGASSPWPPSAPRGAPRRWQASSASRERGPLRTRTAHKPPLPACNAF